MDMSTLSQAISDASEIAKVSDRPTEIFLREDGIWSWRFATDWHWHGTSDMRVRNTR